LLGTSNGGGESTSSTSSRNGNDGIAKGGVGGGPAVLMLAVAASRFGLWAFDLAERQLVQRQTTADGTVRECDRALLFNWERSLCDGMYVVRAPVVTPMSETRMHQCPTRTCIRARHTHALFRCLSKAAATEFMGGFPAVLIFATTHLLGSPISVPIHHPCNCQLRLDPEIRACTVR
jgi:hypothetical protein